MINFWNMSEPLLLLLLPLLLLLRAQPGYSFESSWHLSIFFWHRFNLSFFSSSTLSLSLSLSLSFSFFCYYLYYWVSNIAAEDVGLLDKLPIKQGRSLNRRRRVFCKYGSLFQESKKKLMLRKEGEAENFDPIWKVGPTRTRLWRQQAIIRIDVPLNSRWVSRKFLNLCYFNFR